MNNKWVKAAKARLADINVCEEMAEDMQIVAAAIGKLPPGQLKKILSEDVLMVLEKYGVSVD